MGKALEFAYKYKDRGFAPIPVPYKSKKPKINNWPNLVLSREELPNFFNQEPSNIGIVLGNSSGGLVDIDLDCSEAITLAPYMLPETGMVFGRESRPASHWLYKSPDPGPWQQFGDPDGNGMLVEVRADGCMTIFPCSVHESDEEVRFDRDGEPAEIAFDQLVASVRHFAAACLVLRHWHKGQRHRLALAVSGTLLRGGIDPGMATKLIEALARAAGDEQAADRFQCVATTAERLRAGQPISGRNELVEIIGERATARFCEWLGLRETTKALAPGPAPADGRVSVIYGGPAPYSDTANAERFVARHGERACYIPDRKRWLVWDETRWIPDPGGRVQMLAIETMKDMAKEAIETKDKEYQKFAFQSLDAGRLRYLISLAQGMCSTAPDGFDADPWVLNCRSGVIDLCSGELQPHDPAYMMRKLAPVVFDPKAECPTFLGFLDRIFAGDRELVEFVQRAVGYSLTGTTGEQCLFVLIGNGANGKSTLIRVLQDLLGDYAQQTPMETLMVTKAGGINNDVARLESARFVAAAEAEASQRIAEAKIKQLTGSDTVTARYLYGEYSEFVPQFKLWLATNRLPQVRGHDEGIWRRFRVIPFNVTIPEGERDPTLSDRLRAELSGILNWAVAGCLEWQKAGLRPPAIVTAATKAYRADMDLVMQFVDDCCTAERNAVVTVTALYSSYAEWCHANGEQATTKREFGGRLNNLGYAETRTGKARKRRGIRLKTDIEMLEPVSAGDVVGDASDASEAVLAAE